MASMPQVTVVVPSFNQGRYLEEALFSILEQDVSTEIILLDGGSTDGSREIIERWASRLTYWRSSADAGQGAAINEGVSRGTAPYVTWLNSDDLLKPRGLRTLIDVLESNPGAPAAYGSVMNLQRHAGFETPVYVEPFTVRRLAVRCIISQPGTLIRRSAWETVGGVDRSLYLAMDYDLWWRLYRRFGPPVYVSKVVAVNRVHAATKTRNNRAAHYAEAMEVVRRHYGRLPLKWWLYQPYAVWFKAIVARVGRWPRCAPPHSTD